MKEQTLILVVLFSALVFQWTGAAAKNHHKPSPLDNKRKAREFNTLKELLGKPKENPVSAKAIKGTKKTTRLHKICSWKKHLNNKPDEWTEDEMVYDKLICGLYTMKDEYQKHAMTAAAILAGQHNEKSLEDQKKDLFEAVHRMAKASGPLPRLNLKMIGR